VSQAAFDFRPPHRKKPFDLHRFLLLATLYAFEVVSTIIVLLLLVQFAIVEIQPLINSIWHTLHLP
jgi:hypothetical protein